ncbi:MAG: hypothetical protein RLZZ282_1043, partial [Verrucomicrobiota bacterium]
MVMSAWSTVGAQIWPSQFFPMTIQLMPRI